MLDEQWVTSVPCLSSWQDIRLVMSITKSNFTVI